jgi:class 3 adenylate cyclase/tetratricopeptide (TPR) repeat protein
MKCPKCQAENRETRKFCGKCGAPLAVKCPQCGSENLPGEDFCGECGHDLRKPQEAPSFDYTQPQSYTPKHLADKILTSKSSIEGERKLVSVLFADVANFTSLSEKLDPEEVHTIMDGCFKILMNEIHKYEGTINQFTGDGVMALFSAPVAHEDHAQRACHAALSIHEALGEYGGKVARDFGVDFKMRIGINSGPVIVGAIGDDLRMDYTAVGDTTNLASRMQTMARPGTAILSKNTHRLVKEYFDLKPLGKLEVRGKEEPQEVFELTKAAGATTRLEASVARGLTKFVGRQHSMAALMDAFEKAKNGTGQVVGVVGEAGVGKSRLLFEFRHRLPQGEFNYLEGRCIHYGGSMPYLPILDILRSYLEIGEGERETVVRKRVRERIIALDEKLQGVLPPVQDLLSLKVEDEAYLKLEPKKRKEKVFEALRDLIVRGSHERPLVIAIEDLHWIDKTSEEFLDYFIGWLANIKVMLIPLHRPEYTHRWGSKSYFNRIGVDQLTLKSSAELVKAILEGGETAPELSDLILNRAAGNPLFMEELTHSLLENGSIQMKDKQYVLARKPSELQVPDTIQGIIAARIDRLEENLKRIMQVASVIGREFAFRILQAISGVREDLKSQLLNLQGLELIHEKSLFPELEYIFKHALTQEVAYNSLLLKHRKEIHERIGEAIEKLYPERLEEFYEVLAYHYAKGEVCEKASRFFKLSGNKAVKSHSIREAYSFYKEALTALKRLPATVENQKQKLEVLVSIVAPLVLLGFPDGTLDFFREGESLCKDLQDKRSLILFYVNYSVYWSVKGNPLLGIKYSEEAFKAAKESQDIDLIVSIGYGLAVSYFTSAQFEMVLTTARGILDPLEKKDRASKPYGRFLNLYASLFGFCGLCLGWMGKYPEGELFLRKGLDEATCIGNLRDLAAIEFNQGNFYHGKGDWKAAADHFQKSITHSEEAKYLVYVAWSWSYLGNTCSYLGDAETGKNYGEKGLKMQREIGTELYLGWHYLFLGDTHFHLGDMVKARSLVDEGLMLCQKNHDKYWEALAWIFLGRILGRTETLQINKAEECILKGMKIADELKAKPFYARGHLYLGELYASAKNEEKALENAKIAGNMFQEMRMDYWLDRTRKLLERV